MNSNLRCSVLNVMMFTAIFLWGNFLFAQQKDFSGKEKSFSDKELGMSGTKTIPKTLTVIPTESGKNIDIYSTDFESLIAGQKLACQDTTHWTTYNFTPCGSQDPVVSTDYARSGSQSIMNSYASSVLRLGDKTSGKYMLSFWLYAPADYGGRYWLYHTLTSNSQESACWFGFDEYGSVELMTGDGYAETTYNQDQWFKVTQVIDMDQDSIWFYVNGSLLKSWKWSLKLNGQQGTNQLASAYFDGSENNWTGSPLFYLDDVEYEQVVEAPTLYSTDFESFTEGQKLACQDTTHWTTLNFTPCGSQDPVVSTDYARSGSQSIMNSYASSVLRLGDKTSGKYTLSFWLYAPADYGGRYWLYHTLTSNSQESACWFGFDEYGSVELMTGDGYAETSYNQDEWFKVTQVIDLDQDSAWFYLNGSLLKNWKWSLKLNGQQGTNQLASAYFDGSENNWTGSPLFYLDDVEYGIPEQNVSLEGKITKLADGSPVSGAKININNSFHGSYTATTAADGTYTINKAEAGEYSLTVEKEGFNEITDNITIVDEQTVTKDYQLTAPVIANNTDSLSVTLAVGETATRTITLHNNGDGPMDWTGILLNAPAQKISIPSCNSKFEHSPVIFEKAPITKENMQMSACSLKDMLKGTGSTAYASQWIAKDGTDGTKGYGNSYLLTINTENPYPQNVLGITEYLAIGATFDGIHTNFLYNLNDDGVFRRLDLATCNSTQIGYIGLSGMKPTGLIYDRTNGKFYASIIHHPVANVNLSDLYTIDTTTGAATLVGSTGLSGLMGIAIDGNGQMYGFDAVDDNAYRINKYTGKATLIGSIGFDASYYQGMAWDPVSDNIYLAAVNVTSGSPVYELRVMDRTTGNTSLIGPLKGEDCGLAFPGGGISWANISPSSGTLAAGDSVTVTVTFNGNYVPPQDNLNLNGNLVFSSSPNVGTATVALSITLTGELNGSLSGTVTHGTIPEAGVTVKAIRQENPAYIYTAITGNDGTYNFDTTMYGTYDITAVKEGFNTYSDTVSVNIGQAAVQNIAVTAPTIAVDSSSLTATTPFGTVITRTLHLTNNGDGLLAWKGSLQSNLKNRISIPASDGNFEHTPASVTLAPKKIIKTNAITKPDIPGVENIRGTTAYGYDFFTSTFVSFNTDTPDTATVIASINGIQPLGGTFDANHTDFMYIIDNSDGNIKKINVTTGAVTTVGPAGLQSGDTPTGLTCDRSTGILYASSSSGSDSRIYTIDPVTGASTLIGATGIPALIDITVDGSGQMYGYDITGDNAYAIDKTTGVSTLIGSIGFNANYVQGMCWDPASDNVYLAAVNLTSGYPELRILDRTTGNTTLVGELIGEIDAFAIPGSAGWLSYSPKSGIVDAGDSAEITVTMNGNYLPHQSKDNTMTGNLTFSSDPNVGTIEVPVTFTVETSYGVLEGTVSHGSNNTEGVTITATREEIPSYTYTTVSNANGIYTLTSVLPGTYDITATKEGYNTFTAVAGAIVAVSQTTTYDIEMLAPVMVINPSEIIDSASLGNIITRTLTISNTGNGVLNWTGIAMSGEGDMISIPASDGNFMHSTPELGVASIVNKTTNGTLKNLLGGSTAYAFNIYPNNNFFSFNTDNPSNVTVIGPISNYIYGATFDAVHTDFMYIVDASGNFSKIDVATGEITLIGSLGFPVGYMPTGLSCDRTTGIIYASCSDGSGTSKLYTIDPLTGAGALIGDAGISVLIDIAIDGKGDMYGYDIYSDYAYKIDKTTGASTKLGSIGFDADYSQGMAWDPATDQIYIASFDAQAVSTLRIFDRTTGNSSVVGYFAGETDGLAFPGIGPAWLSIDPKMGTIAPGTSQEVTVTLDGNYPLPSKESVRTGHVVISPEPNVGTVSVPVSFTIKGDIFGTLSGTVTHGNEPVEGVTLTITNNEYPSYTYSAVTGSDGTYAIEAVSGTYKVTAEATGYNGYLADAIEVSEDQTTTLNIPLTAPEMGVTPGSVSVELPQNGTGESTLTISNNGDGVLEWTGGISYDNKRIVISVPSSKGDFPRGTDPVSLDPAPKNTYSLSSASDVIKLGGSTGYAFDILNNEFFSFNTIDPASSNTISANAINIYGGTFDANHTSFMYTIDNEGFLRKEDVTTGVYTNIGMCNPVNTNHKWTGISVDKFSNVMYGVSSDANNSYLYTINMQTAEATVVGPTGIPCCIDIAIDGGGQMYGYDITGDKSYKIDKATGASTLLGFIGFNANYAEGMGWDPVTDVIYLAGYNNNTNYAELRALDKVTGNTQYIGVFNDSKVPYFEVDGLAFPAKWLTASQGSGSIPPGTSQDITLRFNAMDLPEGTYTANVVYNSNAGEGTITIPVTFTIVNPVLSVTPANQDVTYAAGTTSFTVSNTGAGTMNYTAEVTSGSDWLTITSGGSGVNTGTINVVYNENATTSSRVATITITAPGATGSPVQVTVTQGVNSALLPTFTIATMNNVPAGSIVVPVHAANVVNMGSFQFTIEYDPALMSFNSASDWYTGIEAVTMGEPTPGHLTFVWAADMNGINIADGTFFNLNFNWLGSTSTSPLTWSDNPTPREFTDYDGNVFVSVYNNGSVTGLASQPILTVTPTNQDVTSAAGTTTFAVANTGIGTMNYTAAVTTGNDWLTITSGGNGVNAGNIEVSFTENTSTLPRTGIITVTAPGASGSPVNVTVTQAAAPVPVATVTITDTTTLVSGLFVVPVHAENITNMGSFQFTIEYDPSIILFDSITNWYNGIDAVTTGNPSAGHITFVWAADLNGINIADGNFFNINFDWIASDVIQTQVNWSDNPTPREFADYNGTIFVPVYNNGTETGPDGIPEIGYSSVKVFPNPATDVVNITVSNNISTVQVMNYLGMVVHSENITQEKTITLNTSRYSAGNYLVRFVTNNGQTLIKKMVIIK